MQTLTASGSNTGRRLRSLKIHPLRSALLFAVRFRKDSMTKIDSVIVKLDNLLEDDENFTTRIGLKFMTAVMRDALSVIGEVVSDKDGDHKKLGELDKAFAQFLTAQTKREEKAEIERTKWRWAIITPSLGVIILEIARWIQQ
jgi:hypothetical protein